MAAHGEPKLAEACATATLQLARSSACSRHLRRRHSFKGRAPGCCWGASAVQRAAWGLRTELLEVPLRPDSCTPTFLSSHVNLELFASFAGTNDGASVLASVGFLPSVQRFSPGLIAGCDWLADLPLWSGAG